LVFDTLTIKAEEVYLNLLGTVCLIKYGFLILLVFYRRLLPPLFQGILLAEWLALSGFEVPPACSVLVRQSP
jgi:hypothetical protein